MNIAHIFTSQVLFTCFLFALYFSIRLKRRWDTRYPENRIFRHLCFSSAIWSLGFWGINISPTEDIAYYCRCFGMAGVFACFIFVQLLMARLSTLPKRMIRLYEYFAYSGILVYLALLSKDRVTYKMSNIGMTYSFNPGIVNNIYVIYSVMIAVNLGFTVVYTLKTTKYKHVRTLMYRLLLAEIMIASGMLLDTIFPLLGFPAIPGSTIGQFVGLVVIYDAMGFINTSRIDSTNMSKYVYSSMSSPILVFDDNRNLRILNDAGKAFLGIDDIEEPIRIEDMFEVDPDKVFGFEDNKEDIDTVCTYNKIDCSLSVSKIHNDYNDMIGYIIIVSDLTERIQAYRQLEEATREATYANQAKTTFLANMSHEIRTPMNAIIGFSEMILRMDVAPEVRSNVENIRMSSQNLLAIINDILDITKIESGKMELVLENYYLKKMIDDVSVIISQQAQKKGLDFMMEIDPRVPGKLYGDKIRIRGVLINLLNNAVKYTKVGFVSFKLNVLELTDDNVKLEFVVSDSGVGIKEENISQIFKSFNRLEQKVHYGIEGSGLGLAISNAFINMMGGEITVQSTYGKGSVFTVILEQKVIDSAPMNQDFILYSDNHEKLDVKEHLHIVDVEALVVDDNKINLKVAQGLLSSYGLKVDTTSSGAEAIEICKVKKYPLVFMDQMMPEVDGITAMKTIREVNPYYAPGGEGKIIVLTADAIRGARETLLKEGFDEYLGKPMNMEQLESLLVKFLSADRVTYTTGFWSGKVEETNAFAGAEFEYLKSALPFVDVRKGMEVCGNTVKDYLDIIEITDTYGKRHVEELEKYLENEDFENFTIKIHSMKSTLMSIGAVSLSNLAREQEMAGKEQRYSYILDSFDAFINGYLRLLNDIHDCLVHFGRRSPGTTATNDEHPELEERMMVGILSNIKKMVNEFEFSEVFEVLNKIGEYSLNDKQKEFFDSLTKLMDELNVEAIEALIDSYEL